MHKFFVDESAINRPYGIITINGEDVNHIVKVLRLRNGEQIQISDGRGSEFICEIGNADKKSVTCRIIDEFRNNTEPGVSITLYQGLPKSQKMDFIIQKCVEIGVVKIQTVITKRVVVDIEKRDITSKIERWKRISEEAAKQSNRGIIPAVIEPIDFKKALDDTDNFDIGIIPYEKETSKGIGDALYKSKDTKKVGIFIGPEGGFEEDEVEMCIRKGIIPVTLGPRILRTETAGLAASTIVLYALGEMGGFQ